ncbi:hypothetical protein F5880DRAFT_1734860 [Lentinula raphanica]|nr:hypothetical protein EV360DRAFT_79875 [Lentinula raphanica]KAJ3817432.1 hypothetical protein F5880DRAFT_1734860 [Lentinula raphanica]
MFGSWTTLFKVFAAILCYSSDSAAYASPILTARRFRECFDEHDNPIPCPQSKWSKTKIIIICTVVGVVLLLMVASYIMKYRRTETMRVLARPSTITGRYPQSTVSRPTSSPQKDETAAPPYKLSESDAALIPPPPAYTPSYKL